VAEVGRRIHLPEIGGKRPMGWEEIKDLVLSLGNGVQGRRIGYTFIDGEQIKGQM